MSREARNESTEINGQSELMSHWVPVQRGESNLPRVEGPNSSVLDPGKRTGNSTNRQVFVELEEAAYRWWRSATQMCHSLWWQRRTRENDSSVGSV